MAHQRTLDHDAAIRDFKAMLCQCEMRATCGRTYLRTTKLTEWLRGTAGPSSGITQANRLLAAAYRDRSQPGLPISAEQLSTGEDRCLLVFSILLELQFGQLIDRFQRLDLVDKHLPIDLWSLQAKLQGLDLPQPKSLANDFNDIQWRYCAARFDLGVGREHPKSKIIPICKKEEINEKGGTARLWQVAVQEEFVGPKIRKAVPNSRFYDPKDNFGWVSSSRIDRSIAMAFFLLLSTIL